jgi:hypothetical protein
MTADANIYIDRLKLKLYIRRDRLSSYFPLPNHLAGAGKLSEAEVEGGSVSSLGILMRGKTGRF